MATLVSKKEIIEHELIANRLPSDFQVVGLGWVHDAERVKVRCIDCNKQYGKQFEYINIKPLLKWGVPAKTVGTLRVVSIEKLEEMQPLTSFKCPICDTLNDFQLLKKQGWSKPWL